jgi:hypothetical protein
VKKFVEFRKLERSACKSETKFLDLLNERIKTGNLDEAIRALRASGICVDLYGSGKYKVLFQKSLDLLRQRADTNKDALQQLVCDVRIFNALFASFTELRTSSDVDEIPQERQIPALLLTAEILLGAISEYAQGNQPENISKRYPSGIAMTTQDDDLVSGEKVFSQLMIIFDSIMGNLGTVLKYLMHSEVPMGEIETEVLFEDTVISRKHILHLLPIYRHLLRAYDIWRFFGGRLSEEESNNVYFEPMDRENYLAQVVANGRYRNFRTKRQIEFRRIQKHIKANPTTTVLPDKQYRIPKEAWACSMVQAIFSTDNLKEKIRNVSLAEWIRAYTLLYQEAAAFIQQRDDIRPLTLSNWCIAKFREEWVSLIAQAGISKGSSEVIVDALKFTKKSKDVIDCPLIPVGDFLVALSRVLHSLDPSESLLSNLTANNDDVSFKGYDFEESIRQKLTDAGFLCVELHNREGEEEYQCDGVFVIDEDLFIIECKAFLQPIDPRGYYNFMGKVQAACEQLERISDYYMQHIDIIREKLNLPKHWLPKHEHRLIISSAMLGESIVVGNYYITDESNLIRFLDRNPPGLIVGYLKVPAYTEAYAGDITARKLLEVLSNPPAILMTRDMYKETIKEVELSQIIFRNFDFSRTVHAINHLENAHIDEIASKLAAIANTSLDDIQGLIATPPDA